MCCSLASEECAGGSKQLPPDKSEERGKALLGCQDASALIWESSLVLQSRNPKASQRTRESARRGKAGWANNVSPFPSDLSSACSPHRVRISVGIAQPAVGSPPPRLDNSHVIRTQGHQLYTLSYL